MQHGDWGAVSSRSAGIRSVMTIIQGLDVHHLDVDAAPVAPPGAPVHVLVSAMAGSATNWLD